MNLRKDHCRGPNGQSRTRQRSRRGGGTAASARLTPPPRGTRSRPRPASLRDGRREQYPAQWAPRTIHSRRAPQAGSGARCDPSMQVELLRLSATDILALASMKNVAKCDTWCELQNPVNHRVFERKLRPKPFGRGHACLGVTHRVAPPPYLPNQWVFVVWGRILVSRTCCGWPKKESPSADTRLVVVEQTLVLILCH